MPRKKTAFINRSRATTYQLVQRSAGDDGERHVLVPVNGGTVDTSVDPSSEGTNAELFGTPSAQEIDASNLAETYERIKFELGEYGFRNDGYDYSQHFRAIGGGGGVFMDAATGMPNPEAVSGSTVENSTAVEVGKDGVQLKEDAQAGENAGNPADDFPKYSWRMKEDAKLTRKAIEEITRERKRNKDLDEVFAALDSEGELDSSSNLDEELDASIAGFSVPDFGLGDESDLLDDDFVVTAQKLDESAGAASSRLLDGVVEKYRQPRLLDEQFEKFMQSHELASGDGDENGDEEESEEFFIGDASHDVTDLDEVQAHLTNQELEDLLGGEGGLLDDLSKLHIEADVEREEGGIHGAHSASESAAAASTSDQSIVNHAAEYEDIANAEFERGMKGLLDSYNRVPADEVLGMGSGTDKAFEAIARHEREEQAKIEKRLEEGFSEESEGHDSELDSKFDEMFEERDAKWDCETILSTYSNLDNHPSVIDAPSSVKRRPLWKQPIIRLDPRTQAPEGYMPSGGGNESERGVMDFGSSRREAAQSVPTRDRGESKEQKRARKAAVKEAARERRALKSEMRKAFGTESIKQNRHATALGTSKVAMKF